MQEVEYFGRDGRLLKGVLFDYSANCFPLPYRCCKCGGKGGRLWLESKTGKLFCWDCIRKIGFSLEEGYMDLFFPAIPFLWCGNGKLLFHFNGVCFRTELQWWKKLPEKVSGREKPTASFAA